MVIGLGDDRDLGGSEEDEQAEQQQAEAGPKERSARAA